MEGEGGLSGTTGGPLLVGWKASGRLRESGIATVPTPWTRNKMRRRRGTREAFSKPGRKGWRSHLGQSPLDPAGANWLGHFWMRVRPASSLRHCASSFLVHAAAAGFPTLQDACGAGYQRSGSFPGLPPWVPPLPFASTQAQAVLSVPSTLNINRVGCLRQVHAGYG